MSNGVRLTGNHPYLAAGVLAVGGVGIVIYPIATAVVCGICAVGGAVGKGIYSFIKYPLKDLDDKSVLVLDDGTMEKQKLEGRHLRPGLLEGEKKGYIVSK